MDTSRFTGLEILQMLIAGKLPPPSMAQTMGMSLTFAEEGFARFEATAREIHINPMGGVHGGFACTVLDSALGCAVQSALKAGLSYGTIDINIKMMRPVPVNKKLIAEGTLINLSRSLGVSNGKLTDEEGKIYAYGSCTCKVY